VKSTEAAQSPTDDSDEPRTTVNVHFKIQSEKRGDPHEASHLQSQVNSAELDAMTVVGHRVRGVTVSKSGPIVGPVPLRRVVRMLMDGTLGFETRLRVASHSDWITKPGIGYTIDTLNRLIVHSRAQRLAPRVDIYTELDEVALTQELTWLCAQQSEIAATERLLKSLRHQGARALKEDSRHHIKLTLRALCFSTRAEVIKVANNAERFQIQVRDSDDHPPSVFWYTRRVLQNVGLPRATLVERVLQKKGLFAEKSSEKGFNKAENLKAKMSDMELPELHEYALNLGIEMPDLLGGIDINAATEEELFAAIRDPVVARGVYNAAEHKQIDNESDARLHLPGFRQHHAEAIRRAGIRYPSLASFDDTKSFHPALKQVADKDRIKDLGELTIEDRMFDRRVKFDPLSCFFGYTSQEHSSWWFLVELLRKMVVNLVYLRGVDSCDNFPWQECLIVFLIFYALLHNYEMPCNYTSSPWLLVISGPFLTDCLCYLQTIPRSATSWRCSAQCLS